VATTAPATPPVYFAAVQRALLRALCRDQSTMPGPYRLALKLWIEPSGTLARAKRLDTTGDPRLDLAVDSVVQGLDVGQPVPPNLPQPIAILILPQRSQDVVNCPAQAARRAAN
jgi:hypothetical protein